MTIALQSLLGIACLLVAFIVALSGVLFVAWGAGGIAIARQSPSWPTAPGTITRSEVRTNRRANRLPGHRYVIGYEYRVNNRTYDSGLVSGGWFPYGTRRWAQRRTDAYPPGRSVVVHYAPDDPETAVLEPGWTSECWYLVLCPSLLFSVALASLCLGGYALYKVGVGLL